jgi:uncharacterized protein (DUF952 family)
MAAHSVESIYKIVPGSPPVPITPSGHLPPDYSLPVSDLDKRSGFLHMSTAKQIPNTLHYFFASSAAFRDVVFLLRVPLRQLEERNLIRWESPDAKLCGPRNGEGMFPHIYDDQKFKLTANEVESVRQVVSHEGCDGWEAALLKLRDENWLI